jgi:MFS-type transporter involved in bile tolerance (Atg22 family)
MHTFWQGVFVYLSLVGPVWPLFLRGCGLTISQIGVMGGILPIVGMFAIFVSNYVGKIGAKKVAIGACLLRTITFALLIPIPFLASRFSTQEIFIWIFTVIFIFAFFRMLTEPSFAEWMGELVPDEKRGRTDAINNIITGVVGTLVAIFVALISKVAVGLTLFGFIFSAGCIAGFIAVFVLLKLPCGGPKQAVVHQHKNFSVNVLAAFKNKNFVLFLVANNMTWFVWSGLSTFLPIFLREQLAFSQSNVFFMEMWFRLSSVFICFLWGWCADRFGSKPVMMTGIYGLAMIPFPFLLYSLFPLEWRVYIFAVAYIIIGLVLYAFILGANRYFYVGAIPKDASRVHYVVINFTVQSAMMAIAPLLGGIIIDIFHWLNKDICGIHLCPYTPFFIMLICALVIAIIVGRKLVADGSLGTGRFLSMFVEGNP